MPCPVPVQAIPYSQTLLLQCSPDGQVLWPVPVQAVPYSHNPSLQCSPDGQVLWPVPAQGVPFIFLGERENVTGAAVPPVVERENVTGTLVRAEVIAVPPGP